MRRESPGHTLQTSALINEAYLRLVDQTNEMDPRKAHIVEMKFFGGLTNEEVAEVLKVTSRTVEREWRKAKAWLQRAISKVVPNEA